MSRFHSPLVGNLVHTIQSLNNMNCRCFFFVFVPNKTNTCVPLRRMATWHTHTLRLCFMGLLNMPMLSSNIMTCVCSFAYRKQSARLHKVPYNWWLVHKGGKWFYSRTTCSWWGPHQKSIGYHNFDKVGTNFSSFFLWVVHVSQFMRVSFHVGHSPTRF